MRDSQSILEALRERRVPPRPLCVPLFAALASEVDGSAPYPFLRAAGRLALVLRDLGRALPIDALAVDSGSLWDLEMAGVAVESSTWPPRPAAISFRAPPRELAEALRVSPTLEALRRLRQMVPDGWSLAVVVTGPTRFQSLTGLESGLWVQPLLSLVRLALEAGARVVLVQEGQAPPADIGAWVRDLAPLWGTVRFYRGISALVLVEPELPWAGALEDASLPFIPVVDERVPVLLEVARRQPLWGVARRAESIAGGDPQAGAALVTTAGDLLGQISVDGLREAVQGLSCSRDTSAR